MDKINGLPNYSPHPPRLQRLGSDSSFISNDLSEFRKLPSSKYKGVVPQPNGRWGAQIYEKHRRVWIGTFESESEAALSYDIAVYRFRGRDTITNLDPIKDNFELDFISSRSKSEIVDMLRKHTYRDELNHSKRSALSCNSGQLKRKRDGNDGGKEQMFEKVVTPSDVGKLNRLVIPKLYAEKHFPLMVNSASMLMSFEDEGGKVWRFRYSYWNSSQCYVLTKGWGRFVKEKGLKAGGVVVFGRLLGVEKRFYIECRRSDDRIKTHGVNESAEVAVRGDVFRLFGVNYLLDVSKNQMTDQLFPLDQFVRKQCVQAL